MSHWTFKKPVCSTSPRLVFFPIINYFSLLSIAYSLNTKTVAKYVCTTFLNEILNSFFATKPHVLIRFHYNVISIALRIVFT